MMDNYRSEFIKKYLFETKETLDSIKIDTIDKLVSILIKARDNRRTIFVMGNGGSASTASHFSHDLSKWTIVDGKPRFKAISLTDNIPNMLAWANDVSYEDIFVEQLKNLLERGDVVIGISCSGNSKNVIKAIEYANQNGGITVGLSGYDGGSLSKRVQLDIHIPSDCMQRVEDMHLMIEHIVTSLIREEGK